MRGQDNAHLMMNARFVAPARTMPLYRLVHLGAYPGMVAAGACSVVGELYDVPPDTLQRLDAFEEHPDVFVRTPVCLQTSLHSHEAAIPLAMACEAYLLRPALAAGANELSHGDWRLREG